MFVIRMHAVITLVAHWLEHSMIGESWVPFLLGTSAFETFDLFLV